jgi:myo-inositol-1-phosphate synthase
MASLGVWLIGAAGNVGACTLAGWAAIRAGLLPPTGLVTMDGPIGALPLVGFDKVPFGGHEVGSRTIVETVRGLADQHVLPHAVVEAPEVVAALDAAQAEVRDGYDGLVGWDDLQRIRADLFAFRDRHHLQRVVVVNLASTEPPLDAELPADPEAFLAALRGGLRVPASVLYATAAIDLGLAHVNFTPSTGSDLPALHALALARGAVHAGSDGKTGQTLVKTALAPLFAIRRLPVKSWVSHNVLGNEDGRSLHDPARRASKQRSKGAALSAILGYEPEASVAIEYMPSYGDWKVAWDRIQFEGFGGAAMSLELSWRGSDTSLAAPLVIDLIRLVELAQRCGATGVLGHLAVFFKSPIGTGEHRLERQWQALVEHLLKEGAPR